MRLGWPPLVLAVAWIVAIGLSLAATALSAAHGRAPEAFLAVGVSSAVMVTSGFVVARRRPENPIGYLLMLAGVATSAYVVLRYLFPVLAVTVAAAQGISAVSLAWVLLAFPSGRLAGRLERTVISLAVAAVVFSVVADLVTYEPLVHDAPCTPCVPNPLRLVPTDVYYTAAAISWAAATASAGLVAFASVRRWWRATGAARRVLTPVLFGGLVVAVGYVVTGVALASGSAAPFTAAVLLVLRLLVPIGLAVTFVRVYATRGAVARGVIQLGASPSTEALEGALRKALHDRSLIVARWSSAAGAYLDREGRRVELDELGVDRSAVRLERDGQPLAAILHDAALEVDPGLVGTVVDAVRFSVEATDLRDDLRARGGDVAGLPRGEVTFLFGDLEGSTELLTRLGDAYVDVLVELRRIVREVAEGNHGRVVDARADECFLVFAKPLDALEAAVDLQRRLAGATWPSGVEPRMRIGLHLGTPELTTDGYVGLDVHRAARVMSTAHGGQVVASAPLAVALTGHLPEGLTLSPLGYQTLKGIAEPEFLYRVATSGLS